MRWSQCCGSESGSVGSVRTYVFGPSGSISTRYRSGSFYHQAKVVRKTLTPTVLWLLFDFLSLKDDVNGASKSNRQNKNNFLLLSWRSLTKRAGFGSGCGSEFECGSVSQRYGSAVPDPDPYQCHGSATQVGVILLFQYCTGIRFTLSMFCRVLTKSIFYFQPLPYNWCKNFLMGITGIIRIVIGSLRLRIETFFSPCDIQEKNAFSPPLM